MKDQEYDFFYEDKGDTEYCYPGTNILKWIYQQLKKENFLKDITDKIEMANRLAYYLGEINMIPPLS